MRDQTNAIREQVSFKQREEHIRDSWNFLCSHYHLNKSDLVKFLIKKEEYFLRRPETIPSGFIKDWLWVLKSHFTNWLLFFGSNRFHCTSICLRPISFVCFRRTFLTISDGCHDLRFLLELRWFIVRPDHWFKRLNVRSKVRSLGPMSLVMTMTSLIWRFNDFTSNSR